MAEDSVIQYKLEEHGVHVQLMYEVGNIQVFPARVLTQIYSYLGKNSRLGLSGRPSNEIGLLATSKLYMLNDQIYAFIPQFMDEQQFYLTLDTSFTIDLFRTEVAYLKNSWKGVGRPTLTLAISHSLLDTNRLLPNALIGTIKKLQSGYIAGTRVHLGDLSHFLTTSCVTKLSFATDDIGQGTTEQHLSSLLGEGGLSTCQRPRLLTYSRKTKKRGPKSRSSVSGIVRRSRSIQVDAEQIPALHASLRRLEKGAHSAEMEDTPSYSTHLKSGIHGGHLHHERAVSPVGSPMRSFLHESMHGHQHQHHHHDNVSIKDLITQLEHTEILQEQADIVHYLFLNKGLEWEMEIGGRKCSVKELLVELYEKAGHWKQWWLVRHTAGMLHKRVEDLALAATDMLVRQKQLSVGLPPHREKEITRPLPPDELATIIYDACGEDLSTASLTQELLIYLAMFIRTEPKLLKEMLRLRVGLIIQVMASELARTLKCSGDEASDHLLNLSPFEMKTLLHHILSGKEFVISSDIRLVSVGEQVMRQETVTGRRRMSDFTHTTLDHSVLENEDDIAADRQGQWLRRRRLDGSLNRVPVDFYPRVWKILSKIQGLSLEGHFLPQSLTKEMTAGEFKFALRVEMVLNSIPQPEYRQLMVEALMVLTMLTEGDFKFNMNQVIHVDKMVQEANRLFINDQKIPQDVVLRSQGAAGICLHLYDSAPSGRYGTMSYLCRALAKTLNLPSGPNDDCVVS
ncbi:hypothetical protein KUTeg_024980 [Tegillarca granosa]|uniref:Phosphorylase b kinase regulatory subunit n=1 Tax=Tegillarca granosa TaxID=220873 RepID=A0ABQ9DZF4_TEGGR|nr:hypothetical protein KUTeg_024980 [Tegillarca granosa]